eukprot:TRINITY_DN18801_c0_g2_i21.p1 TRINITY_DN18801_c0_g2~~TRINITY_DN18801_c0_g2_i21.p1  ORF type:complete len:206 (-),score=10.52 TRINITY_DN18801_c0_g2_i21:106-723(-)
MCCGSSPMSPRSRHEQSSEDDGWTRDPHASRVEGSGGPDSSSMCTASSPMTPRSRYEQLSNDEGLRRTSQPSCVEVCRGPDPPSVPIPYSLMQRCGETPEQKLARLTNEQNQDLQGLLRFIATHLLDQEDQTERAMDLGRRLPRHLRAWLRDQDLRVGRILKCYPWDFRVYEEDTEVYAQYLHSRAFNPTFAFRAPAGYQRTVRL